MASDIDDVLDACHTRSRSMVLRAALLDALAGPTPPEGPAFLAELPPDGFDKGHRRRVADFVL